MVRGVGLMSQHGFCRGYRNQTSVRQGQHCSTPRHPGVRRGATGRSNHGGVFVTTGRFSSGALQFADNVAMRLRLIDGKELTRLMVRYKVGVQARETFELKQIDEETFDE